MAASASSSLLLALPIELRLKIFKQLLCPDPNHIYPLYHDRLGRDAFASRQSYQELVEARTRLRGKGKSQPLEQSTESDQLAPDTLPYIDPRILRVNHQIYTEASPLLYDKNTYLLYLATPITRQCSGGFYYDGITDPPGLFRIDGDKDVKRTRLRRINIATSAAAVWGSSMGGRFFSHVGRSIWKILHIMADTRIPGERRLRLTLECDWWGYSFSANERSKMDKKLRPIFGMMKALKRKVNMAIEVEVEVLEVEVEEILQPLSQYIAMNYDEVDHWEKALLTDTRDSQHDVRAMETEYFPDQSFSDEEDDYSASFDGRFR